MMVVCLSLMGGLLADSAVGLAAPVWGSIATPSWTASTEFEESIVDSGGLWLSDNTCSSSVIDSNSALCMEAGVRLLSCNI